MFTGCHGVQIPHRAHTETYRPIHSLYLHKPHELTDIRGIIIYTNENQNKCDTIKRFRVNIYTATDWQARVAYIFINTYLVRRDVCFAQETEAKRDDDDTSCPFKLKMARTTRPNQFKLVQC